MPRLTILVSSAICASALSQSKETSSGIVKRGTASTRMVKVSTSAQSRIAHTASMGDTEDFEDDWIMPNDISRDNTQDKMRQYYKELKLKRQCERYKGCWRDRAYFKQC
jgi:hypothetical protein